MECTENPIRCQMPRFYYLACRDLGHLKPSPAFDLTEIFLIMGNNFLG